MTNLIDDPKLTAYALGEYEALGPGEREALERAVAADPELSAYVESLRQAAGTLEASLAAEPAPGLAAEQKAAIERQFHTAPKPVLAPHGWTKSALALAAAVMLLATLALVTALPQARRYAKLTPKSEQGRLHSRAERALGDKDRAIRGLEEDHERILVDIFAAKELSRAAEEQNEEVEEVLNEIDATLVNSAFARAEREKGTGSVAEHPKAGIAFSSNKERPLFPIGGGPGTENAQPAAPRLGSIEALERSVLGDLSLPEHVVVDQTPANPGTPSINYPTYGFNVGTLRGMTYEEVLKEKIQSQRNTQLPNDGLVGESQQVTMAGLSQAFQQTPASMNGYWIQGWFGPPAVLTPPPPPPVPGTETYEPVKPNPFKQARGADAVSTFSIDVDRASYANVRRFLNQGQLPPEDAVRIEELINYFDYGYAPPADAHPFAAHTAVATCPWNPKHRIARIGIKGREIAWEQRPQSNLVFLLDVSGSMNEPNKLPLVKNAMKLLIEKLGENDRVSMVVYAGAAGLVLPPTRGDAKPQILAALENLQAGGSTNGGQGIELAYATAKQQFIKGGANRVILCTDGDFNVGVSDRGGLVRLIEEQAQSGVFLSVLGFGMGNYQDANLEQLADKGNGNYAYIDTEKEARKVFVHELAGTLLTIAKDVKIQVEFNPAQVDAYRLLGYENRMLAREDFNDDAKDAGEIGAGHCVTALYEIVPKGRYAELVGADPLKYQEEGALTSAADNDELFTLKLRYKQPDGEKSTLMETTVTDNLQGLEKTDLDFRFAAAVAYFGMQLRQSPYRGNANWELVRELATESKGADANGYRAEFLQLVERAAQLATPPAGR